MAEGIEKGTSNDLRTPEEGQNENAYKIFDEAIANVRAGLTKAGHLELVTAEGFREAKSKLYQAVGQKAGDNHMNEWFAVNMAN